MSNAAMPNLPGFGSITDTMEFVRTMWGGGKPGGTAPGIGIPGMVMPTLSVEEVNKQIADLKAVESWLILNMNMLRGTIQALEVQSATITALKSMGEAFSSSVKTAAAGLDQTAEKTAGRAQENVSEKASEKAAGRSSGWPSSPVNPSEADELERLKQNRALEDEDAETAEAPEASQPPKTAAAGTRTEKTSPAVKTAGAAISAPMSNPAVWWNLLQDQFKQAVGNAMAGESTEQAGKQAVNPLLPKTTAPGDKRTAGHPRKTAPTTPKRGMPAGILVKSQSVKKSTAAKPTGKRAAKLKPADD